jgi:hypothetical protein
MLPNLSVSLMLFGAMLVIVALSFHVMQTKEEEVEELKTKWGRLVGPFWFILLWIGIAMVMTGLVLLI